MKQLIITIGTLCWLLALTAVALGQEAVTPTSIDFGNFSPPEDGTFVEIKVSSGLINMAARLTKESEPEMARILEGLRSIRVNVIELDGDKNKEITSRIHSIRRQLEQQEWERVVTVKEDNEDVGIYVKLKDGESIDGVVVTVIAEGEVVLIHVDGNIRPEELAQVGERLNIEPLAQLAESIGSTK